MNRADQTCRRPLHEVQDGLTEVGRSEVQEVRMACVVSSGDCSKSPSIKCPDSTSVSCNLRASSIATDKTFEMPTKFLFRFGLWINGGWLCFSRLINGGLPRWVLGNLVHNIMTCHVNVDLMPGDEVCDRIGGRPQ